jgi:UDP-N-acetyl-2-amino-2-deoxyglucuronate dehydrogenase
MSGPEPEPADPPAETWAVWRIDDNANTFLVRGGLERAEAERLAAEFTARGHKQMYWVEREVVVR